MNQSPINPLISYPLINYRFIYYQFNYQLLNHCFIMCQTQTSPTNSIHIIYAIYLIANV